MTHVSKRNGSLLLAALVSLGAACTTGQRLGPATNAEEAILAQERRALDQWSQGNPVGYGQSAAEEVTYFDDIAASTRINGRDAWQAYLTSLMGKVPPHRYELIDPKVQVYGDVGVLTLRYHAFALDGRPLTRWKATSVYRWDGNEWRMVHANWSTIKEPDPAAPGA